MHLVPVFHAEWLETDDLQQLRGPGVVPVADRVDFMFTELDSLAQHSTRFPDNKKPRLGHRLFHVKPQPAPVVAPGQPAAAKNFPVTLSDRGKDRQWAMQTRRGGTAMRAGAHQLYLRQSWART